MTTGTFFRVSPLYTIINFIDTVSPHIASRIYDFLQYDAATIGNHDVETGHHVYDRWIAQTSTPILGANVVSAESGEPYLTPYTVIERQGVKIAILGLLTPAIPAWLPENLWSGLRFEDMEECAENGLRLSKKKNRPTLLSDCSTPATITQDKPVITTKTHLFRLRRTYPDLMSFYGA